MPATYRRLLTVSSPLASKAPLAWVLLAPQSHWPPVRRDGSRVSHPLCLMVSRIHRAGVSLRCDGCPDPSQLACGAARALLLAGGRGANKLDYEVAGEYYTQRKGCRGGGSH